MKKKEYKPNLRIISVDHDRTSIAANRLRRALDANGFKDLPLLSSFCHLEAGRCGIKSGAVAIDVDGRIIWAGPEVTEKLAESFCRGLPEYIRQKKAEYGLR